MFKAITVIGGRFSIGWRYSLFNFEPYLVNKLYVQFA